MSRIANNPVSIPSGVEISISGQDLNVKGSKGNLSMVIHELVEISQEDDCLKFKAIESRDRKSVV